MIEERYILTSTSFEGELELRFALNGNLTAFFNRAELSEKQQNWLASNFPMTVVMANEMIGKASGMSVARFPAELTFEVFWKKYDLKIDKDLALKEWNKMSVSDQIKAYLGIDAYDKYLSKSGEGKIYAVRYLNRRRFEVDYKELARRK